MGVTVLTPGGHASLDPALALLRHLLGPSSVVVTPSPQPHDPHKEFVQKLVMQCLIITILIVLSTISL